MVGVIDAITVMQIEYAPDPAKALMVKTSFDAFIEYRHASVAPESLVLK